MSNFERDDLPIRRSNEYMNMELCKALGRMFVLLSVVFAMGLIKPFVRHFYPASPGFPRRLAAPIIFVVLAMACFKGLGSVALILVVLSGLTQIIISRRRRRNARHAA
jgi:hypothetical protein